MNRVGISVKPNDMRAIALLSELGEWLGKKQCTVFVDESLDISINAERLPISQMHTRVELMIVLGGDGTLLYIGRQFIGSDTPILGINLGRLGFLTDTPIGSMFDVVEEILSGNMKIKRFFSLNAETWRGDERLNIGHAMNDVVLQRQAHPRMIGFEMFVRDQLVFRIRGDGLVLATPVGSTAYALSAGGPIVHPEVDAISVVPVCAHTLSGRPIIVSANDEIGLHLIESPLPAALNLDGLEHMVLEEGDRVIIRKGGCISLIHLPEWHYFNVLRSKLNWAGHVEFDD